MNHRVKRVTELIKRELATILERNFQFSGSLVTIHDVDITPDLKQCFIYTGVIGKETSPDRIIKKLNDSRSTIQRELFKRVILKNSPSLLFKADSSVERGVHVLNLIENLPPIVYDEPLEETVSHDPEDDDEDEAVSGSGEGR
ncbi:MAG: ribosome-binding factor RbfA [Verrucomicrobiota bacterium]